MTNTDWQAYSGEKAISYFSRITGLTVQNFLSAATGIAGAMALIRGLVRQEADTLGNFWVDLTRSVLWLFLPLSLMGGLLLVQQGVIQNFSPYLTVKTLEGGAQTIAMGPAASHDIITFLGTNGGGVFAANSAHPFENPTPLSNFLEMVSIIIVPAALVFTFGEMVGNRRQAWPLLAAMLLLFMLALAVGYGAEYYGNPLVKVLGVEAPTAMEGKELRLGIANSTLFSTVITAATCGTVNNMHDSRTPLSGLMLIFQMMLQVVFGGVGAGLYGMIVFALLTVFIAGLMVGRTPEYLGKKIEAFEMKMAVLAVLIPAASILIGTAIAAVTPAGTSSILNPGPHGLSEMLYAFDAGTANNGSAFAGLNSNTLFYNLGVGWAMLIGRFGVLLPVFAIAGSLARKKYIPPSPGTFPTTGLLFTNLLVAVIIIVGALTFFPVLALGPIVEHYLMIAGKVF